MVDWHESNVLPDNHNSHQWLQKAVMHIASISWYTVCFSWQAKSSSERYNPLSGVSDETVSFTVHED